MSAVDDGRVRLKLETLQPTFSYKLRGALNAVLRRSESAQADRPLVTASAGNHGRALAYAARTCGVPVTVYVSERAPAVKIDAIRGEGADLRLCPDYDAAERAAKQHAARGDATYISPYAHPDVIAGAGTVGLEILEDWDGVDTIVAAVGGGGLISGIAIAAAGCRRPIRVVGVEAQASTPFTSGLAAGHIVEVDVQPTLADGLAGNLDPDTPTFDMVRTMVSGILTVSEAEISEAVAGVARYERLIAEGAGATAVAAVLAKRERTNGKNVAVVLSGANIDAEIFTRLVNAG